MPPPRVEPPERLRHRRAASRRATRRRRLQAGAVLAVLIVLVASVVLRAGSGKQARDSATGLSATGHATAARSGRNSGQAKPPASRATSANASAAKGTGTPGKTPVPILMYHVIAAPPAGAPFPGLYVNPSEFAQQMHALKGAGWHAVTLDQVQANWQRGVPLGAGKPIVLSFDNGYRSQYSQALPVLRGLGWVGDENLQLSGLPPSQGGLRPEEIKGLVAAGWELDTQGFNHADLIALDAEQLRYQVATTRGTLQRHYGVPVNWFCYPSGHYDSSVIAAVKAAGYTGSTTVVAGWAHPSEDRYRLHRLRVLGETSPKALLGEIADIREDPSAPPSYNGA